MHANIFPILSLTVLFAVPSSAQTQSGPLGPSPVRPGVAMARFGSAGNLMGYDEWSSYAESIGGRLISLTTQAEHEGLRDLLAPTGNDIQGGLIGLRRADPSSPWVWENGDALGWPLSWAVGGPSIGAREVLMHWKENYSTFYGMSPTTLHGTAFLEFDDPEDCDGNGFLDAWELATSGATLDQNGNGVIDTCELPAGGVCASPAFAGWGYHPTTGGRLFSADLTDPVATWSYAPTPPPSGQNIAGIDFNASGTHLFGIFEGNENRYGQLDEGTGVWSVLGYTGLVGKMGGISAHPDGDTWFAVTYSVFPEISSQVWRSDSGLYSFTPLGPPMVGVRFADIACDSQGRLYCCEFDGDDLYSVDPSTGVGALLGPIGVNLNGSQGMDFDWTSDTLHAMFATSPGCQLVTLDTSTGSILSAVNVYSLAIKGELAVKGGVPGNVGGTCCLGDGTGTVCPCGANGNPGEGCTNTTGRGALLTAFGDAVLSSDSFGLGVAGLPAGKVGLVVSGSASINNGLGTPMGAGLYCVGGVTKRSHAQFATSGSTVFTDFQGGSFGASSSGVGVLTVYQFWYRDPQETCSGAGFNFSNAWGVVWTP